MGYYYCKPRANDTHTSNVVLILAVALILLIAPKLFSSEPEEEVEVESGPSPLLVPILVIMIVVLISWLGSSGKRVCAKPRNSSVLDGFTLNPLPYPVLLILAVIFIFLGTSWYLSYEEVVETAQEQLGWLLFATPVLLIFIVRLVSSMEDSGWFSGSSLWDSRGRTQQSPSEGSSPWGVAALIVVLLILVQFQSSFLDGWFY
ncbi:hypothetical protein QL285_020059 [Trifolium repens]|nr:hypothetical protein QL285_020059 [Trifolium repens]